MQISTNQQDVNVGHIHPGAIIKTGQRNQRMMEYH